MRKYLPQAQTFHHSLVTRPKMSGRCQLLDLPDAIIEQALGPACTTRSLASLAASCAQLRRLCLRAAEALLQRACAAGTSEAALAMGAATIHDLARMCGRHPVIPEKFLAAVLERIQGPFERVSIAALQRLFIVFAASEPTLFPVKAGSWNAFHYEPGQSKPSYRFGNDDNFGGGSDLPVVRVVDAAGCYCSSVSFSRMVDTSHVDLALRQVFNLDVHPPDLPFGPFNRRTCAMLDFTTDLNSLAQQEEDDDSSPDFEPGPDPPAPPEEFGLVGVTIDGVWFPSEESFFDDNYNSEDGSNDLNDEAYGSPCGDGLCECLWPTLDCGSWHVRPQQCMDALPLFELAVGQQEEGWGAASCFTDGVLAGPAQPKYPMTSDWDSCGHPIGYRRRHREVHPDVANAVSLAAHELACQQPSKWPKTCPHPAVIVEKGQLARSRAWRRQGERDATATLALLGKHIVEGVYRDTWVRDAMMIDDRDTCF